jgi:nucleotide-binding universal stress UspA family protein/cold shock CspA family protein
MKILLPTDGSRYALAAARAISGWFSWTGGQIDVLAVTPEEPKSDRHSYRADAEGAKEWRGTVHRWLAETEDHLRGSGLETREIVRSGDAAKVVLDAAAEGYDLVVVGVKGRSESPHFSEDSVALALLAHAPQSILLVRERRPSGREHRLPTPQDPLRVLLAVDGRNPSEKAVAAFSRLLAVDRAEVVVTAVADAATGGLLGEVDARRVARNVADRLAGRNVTVDLRVAEGDVVSAIRDGAADADLIVMGSRATREPGEPYLASVGMAVAASSPCSVLVVRGAAPEGVLVEAEPLELTAIPFEIAYENMEPSPAAEQHVLRGLERLEHLGPEVLRARVTLARRNPRHLTGNLYDVHIALTLPGPDISVSRTAPPHHESEDLVTAIGEAFDSARRSLLESHAVNRGDVKSHEPAAAGEVTDVFPDYGFIRAKDGRVVYFHKNSVVGGDWSDVDVGTQVTFVDELGEQGPQATTVHVTRRRSAIR